VQQNNLHLNTLVSLLLQHFTVTQYSSHRLPAECFMSGHLHAPADLPLGEITPGTHWIGLAGPRANLGIVQKRKILPLPGP
jgi:hypothetical protein